MCLHVCINVSGFLVQLGLSKFNYLVAQLKPELKAQNIQLSYPYICIHINIYIHIKVHVYMCVCVCVGRRIRKY